MSFTPQGQLGGTSARDARPQGAAPRRVPSSAVRHGNDNAKQVGAADDLARSKKRTWETFARWLIFGGLLWAVGLIGLLAFIYSRYP